MGKDKKLNAEMHKTKLLQDEIQHRLKESATIFNNEDKGHL
jgi:hypothetical protein